MDVLGSTFVPLVCDVLTLMATNNLRGLLERHGIYQAQLARESGVSPGAVNRYVNERRSPSPVTAARLAKALSDLVGDSFLPEDLFPQLRRT